MEAVRILPEGLLGASQLLRQAWERYRLPVAITERTSAVLARSNCDGGAMCGPQRVRHGRKARDVRAVTAWSAFGAFDWDSLVTRERGHNEPGSFDVRSDPPALHGILHPACQRAWLHSPATGGEPQSALSRIRFLPSLLKL